ncbi:MAG: DUF1385 domain-containing protein [Oscillospiraceae bacterium]
MRRLFAYHGAEHKTIRRYEAKIAPDGGERAPSDPAPPQMWHQLPAGGDGAVHFDFFHCVFPVVGHIPGAGGAAGEFLFRLIMIVYKLLLLPLVVAVAYEINRWVGRYDNVLTRIVTAPGMWFQNFTTNEPDDSMIEVGIAALQAVLPEEEGADQW